jgi:filamentous hemagglutinin
MDKSIGNYRVARTVAAILALAQAAAGRQGAQAATLPVPCVASTCIATNPANPKATNPGAQPFVTSGSATATQVGNTLTVNQTSANAILNWQSFNISADGAVRFQQPTATSVALNRIYQQSPSSIFGSLSANGQVYLINPNGIVFGQTAKVNVSGLIASSLGISDNHFNAGLLSPSILNDPDQTQRAALSAGDNTSDPVLRAADGSLTCGEVTVAAGAQISAPGGRILLAGTNVSNAGTLSAPDGQVVLAAGQKVYLQANTDQSLRGLIVEVDQGGTAENQLNGLLSADRGNVSMIGLAVNQNGRISATTAVAANGSVRLDAAQHATFQAGSGNTTLIAATQGGTLELGAQSSIDIEPELGSTATTTFDPAKPQLAPLPSQINLTGEKILMEGGSIKAPGGTLNVTAAADPSVGIGGPAGAALDPNAEIRVHNGTTIDLSGTDYELPMSANLLAIQLRSNELADDPTQRGGPLQGQTVYVDTRTGTNIVGKTALQQAEAAVPHTIGYFTTAGGKANFQSAGDVVFEQGASVNVSGGKTTYGAGVLQTTQLIGANGKLYDIGTANPLLSYTGVLNPTFTASYNKWGVQDIIATPGLGHYESGYVQGSSAGSVTFAAPAMALDGTLTGHAVNGPYQRSVASGGTLIIGLQNGIPGSSTGITDYLTPAISLTNQPPPIAIQDGAALLDQQVQLPVDFLTTGGFTNTQIYGNTTVTIPAGLPLNMLPGSSLLMDAPRINVFSNLISTGGNIQLESVQTQYSSQASIGRLGVQIGDGVTIDVRGQWTNDSSILGSAQPTGLILKDGGNISISLEDDTGGADTGAELVIGNNVSLRASGGAWVSRTNSLKGGAGGSITLSASPLNSAMQIGSGVELDAYGVNGALGGNFALTASRISIAPGSANGAWSGAQRVDDLLQPGGVLTIDPSLFSNYGFSKVALTATGLLDQAAPNADVLTVDSGTHIYATAQTLLLNPDYLMRPGATTLDGLASLATLPPNQLNPSQVVLGVAPMDGTGHKLTKPGLLDVQAGASITTDSNSHSSILLEGEGGVYVDGTLRSLGGTITLQTLSPQGTIADPGYRAGLSLELGSHAVIDVSGTVISTPSDLGYQMGTVLDAGTVNLWADRGTVVTDPKSLIKLQGGSAALDVPAGLGSGIYNRYTVGSNGGTLSVRSPETISLLGGMEASAGAGDYGNPSGGSFVLDLSRLTSRKWYQNPGNNPVPFPTDTLDIQLVSSTGPSPSARGMAVLGVSQLEGDGFDSLQLFAQSKIEFSTSTPLNFARQAVFDSPLLTVDNGVNASVNANYVALSDSQPLTPDTITTSTLLSGSGTLSVQAQQIDLLGAFAISGARKVTLDSSGDVQLRGIIVQGTAPAGAMTTNGNLEIDAARIYPSTLTSYTVTAQGTGNSITIGQTNPSPGTPLSAGGTMTLQADQINSAGTLIAPFGQIMLSAQTQLNLEAGSMTSVSGAGATIPFGQTELNGQQWVYGAAGYSTPAPQNGIPSRLVTLKAPKVSLASGATVDLQGGGDLYAYEWVPGTGGTQDALAPPINPTGNQPQLFAVLPSMVGQFAPYDPQNQNTLAPGQSIYLSGGAGLAAGIYPLLPARDALLPGAFLVEVQPGYSNIVPGQKASLADGTPVIAGYTTFGTTGLHSGGYEGVSIWPGSHARQLATYQDSYASTYFAAIAAQNGSPTPNLPTDAGQLSIAVDESLNIAGNVLANPFDSKGKGAIVDISANNLEVTKGSGAPTPPGFVGVAASVIDGWHVGELLLGGNTDKACNACINVQADSIIVDTGVQLAANQVIAVANQSIDLKTNASILSSSALPGGTAPAQPLQMTEVSLTNSAGPASGAALLAVSDSALPVVSRPITNPIANPASITLESGSTLGSQGAISIDAPGQVSLHGTLNGSGASWSLASSSIGFVGKDTSKSDTLQITSNVQSELASASAIRLSSLTGINLYTQVNLGGQANASSTNLTSLTLSAQSLNNLAAPGVNSSFTAKTIDIQGVAGAPPPPPPVAGSPGSGSLSFSANEFDVGTPPPNPTNSIQAVASNQMSISGVSDITINATTAFVAQGTGAGLLTAANNLSITAPVFTAANGASAQISATGGTLSLAAPGGVGATSVPSTYLGGELDFSADTIKQSGNIIVPAGIVSMTATHGIDLSGHAMVDTSGTTVNIAGKSVGAEGGRILLSAGTYNGSLPPTMGGITLGQNTKLNASGAGDAQAGLIQLTATGAADLSGRLQAQPGTGAQAGQFVLDAGSIVQNLDVLTGRLQSQSGGFGGGFGKEVSIRTRTGDLSISSGTQLTANQVSLTADSGSVNIAGTITATNADVRGQIQLFGNQGVNLSGQLHADATGTSGVGGDIEIGTGANGSVNLLSGSAISATGAAGRGSLTVRAPLINANTNIAVADAGSNLSGLGQIVIEPIMTEAATSSGSEMMPSDYARIQQDMATKMASSAANISTSLNASGTLPLVVRPAVDVVQSGDLLLDQPGLDLSASAWRFNDQPVDLTFRATGSITLNTMISDGFQPVKVPKASGRGFITTTGMIGTNHPDGTPYDSASISLVAGADTNSVNPFALAVGGQSNLTIGAGSGVRTGTGNISLVASQDIQFGQGAEVYTAGRPGAPIVALLGTSSNSTSVFNFPTAGGNIVVSAGRDILGTLVPDSHASAAGPSITAWQVRQGNTSAPAQWGIDFAAYSNYGWNLGSLGGGDLTVNAGRDITTLAAAAADSYAAANSKTNTAAAHFSSGGLAVQAGRDIGTSEFYAADGSSVLNAGGGFTAVLPDSNGTAGSLIALNDAKVSVEARTGIVIDALVNPTAIPQLASPKGGSAFFTYTADSALVLQSSSGDVNLRADTAHLNTLLGSAITGQITNQIYPSTLEVRSLSQDVGLSPGNLFPSSNGQFEAIAGRDILVNGALTMSDAYMAALPTVSVPQFDINNVTTPFASDAHSGDLTPALLVAGRDIQGNDYPLSIPKATDIIAGRDIVNLAFLGQNLNPNDVTLISAGRDYVDTLSSGNGGKVLVGGPGSLDILAGRNLDLGLSQGVITSGNLYNPNLPTSQGANVTMMAGLGKNPDYSGFLNNIVAPDAGNQAQLVSFVEGLNNESGLTFAQAETQFNGLDTSLQWNFLNQIFFHELQLSGQEANMVGYGRGYAAIDALFPNSRTAVASGPSPYAGDVSLTFSQVYTQSGGNISIFAPGGGLNVGLAVPPVSLTNSNNKQAYQLGIVAQGAGDVNIYTKNDVIVNSSRIFTLGGGNILIWSDERNIDAGRGAKSSTSAPPPVVVVDTNGNILLDFQGAVSGSGIRTIQANPNVGAGNVELVAPAGTINAGDAGIGAAGNITLAALHVLGVDNIQYGGQAVGVPPLVSNIGVTLAGVSNVANSATNNAQSSVEDAARRAESAAPLAQAAISWLDVFVTGLGAENCRPDDLDCLKRQKKD